MPTTRETSGSTKTEDEEEGVVDPSQLVQRQVRNLPPNARASTAPTISHMTRACSVPISTSGWKLAGGVEVEVGQTMTVESARRSSAWTITAYRRPC
jgi:hypothetical protein